MTGKFTVAGLASLQQEIRKSRFLAKAVAVQDPEQAIARIATLGDPLATHNCWAYRIGQQYRISDDGEPGGTAGRPILQAIEAQHCDQVAVVVTRWYGGTKLGAGGLARAYGGCAAECLRLAERIEIVDCVELKIACDFSALPILHARLAEFSAEKINESFDADGAQLQLRVPRGLVDPLSDFLRDLSRGRASVEIS